MASSWRPSLPSTSSQRQGIFANARFPRRLDLCAELNARLCAHARLVLPDALAAFPCLAGFDIHAGDGHYHAHAVNDPADSKGNKHVVGHLYARNLRSGTLSHLTVNDQLTRKKEHDIRGLKRQTIDTLRQGAKKGRKVLYVWDRAGIDFNQWHKWKQGSGIYMLSRSKTNMALIKCGDLPFDHADSINAGVLRDELVGSASGGVLLRRVTFLDVLMAAQQTSSSRSLSRLIFPTLASLTFMAGGLQSQEAPATFSLREADGLKLNCPVPFTEKSGGPN